MFRKVHFSVRVVLLLITVGFAATLGHTHPGRTDANSRHTDRETCAYHTHVEADPQSDETKTDLPVGQNALTSDEDPSTLKLAAWNIRMFSDASRDDADLQKIAQTLIDYDFIAIVELHDDVVLQRTQEILSQLGTLYDYQFSPAVGRGVKERYAFLYKKDRVNVVKQGELYPDAADGTDDFIRDPYWATFRAGAFEFSVIVVHVIWGETVAPEKRKLKHWRMSIGMSKTRTARRTFSSSATSTETRMTRKPTAESWQSPQ